MPVKRKFYRYSVVGRGVFPMDMLRYDQAWPRNSWDAAKIGLTPEDGGYLEPRTVALESYKEPTSARWFSFGWVTGTVEVSHVA